MATLSLGAAGMEPPCTLWVALALLGAVKGQTLNTPPTVTPALQSFQEDQFQGEWFVLGLAGSSYRKVDRSLLSPFIATFEPKGSSRLKASYAMMRHQRCVTWSYMLTPMTQPGKFSVDGSGVPGAELQVQDTNYSTFALVLFRGQSGGWLDLRVNLLCRAWEIQAQVLDRFVCLVRAKGLSKDNVVFPDLTGSRLGRAGPGRRWATCRWASKTPWEPMGRHGPRAGSMRGARQPRGSAWAQTTGLMAPWSLPPPGSPSWATSSLRRASHRAPAFPASGPLCVHATCTPMHARVHRQKYTLVHTYCVLCPQAHATHIHLHTHCSRPRGYTESGGPCGLPEDPGWGQGSLWHPGGVSRSASPPAPAPFPVWSLRLSPCDSQEAASVYLAAPRPRHLRVSLLT
ncbi:epididymal-specific lipocalin-12 isoform X3 [Pteropus medius]|uniref:epididymal-specific lipocalin-12 isoform X3 n=1 Tax=Pteropus vampyrus TaxID=132908 RepID=UPI00196A8368|nr:epididymal-specific lipocalin-12 isoform X3 [Pteropus giganteus]